MQITIRTQTPLAADAELARQIEAFVRDLMGRHREQVLELDVHPGQADSLDDDMHCVVSARLVGGHRLTVNHAAPTLGQAVHGAIGKVRGGIPQPAC